MKTYAERMDHPEGLAIDGNGDLWAGRSAPRPISHASERNSQATRPRVLLLPSCEAIEILALTSVFGDRIVDEFCAGGFRPGLAQAGS